MKALFCAALVLAALASASAQSASKPVPLFDGRSFQGWEGDTQKTWRIEDGAIVGGSLKETVPHNDFLCTTRSYENFILHVKVKLTGTEGFINGGVQFRSQRLTKPAYEMIGYQADIGAGYWGSLYDESRRKKTLAQPDKAQVEKLVKPGDWNDYEIRAEGPRIRLFLNGQQTMDYTESDPAIPRSGLIGLQIHGGGKAQIAYRDITIQELAR
jgi:3-keto-disaccharide hydrolase